MEWNGMGRIKGANPPQFAPAAPAWPLATAVSGHFNSRPPTRALRERRELRRNYFILFEWPFQLATPHSRLAS